MLALPLPVTVFAGKAALDVHAADIENRDFVTCTFSALGEGADHGFRIAGRSGTAVQYDDFHFKFSSKKLLSFANGIFSLL